MRARATPRRCFVESAFVRTAGRTSPGDAVNSKNGESGVLLPKELSAKRPMLSAKQFDSVRASASLDSSAAETFVVLAWRTGHRGNSIRHLRWSDVDLQNRRLHWSAEHDKVGREHVTPMHADVFVLLHRDWQIAELLGAAMDSWVFPAPQDESAPIGRDTLNNWWRRFARAASCQRARATAGTRADGASPWRSSPRGVALRTCKGLADGNNHATLVEMYLQPDRGGERRASALDDSP